MQWIAIKRYCQNCGKLMIGYKSSDGMVKMECGNCHTYYVSKRISRRKERVEITAPPGQILLAE